MMLSQVCRVDVRSAFNLALEWLGAIQSSVEFIIGLHGWHYSHKVYRHISQSVQQRSQRQKKICEVIGITDLKCVFHWVDCLKMYINWYSFFMTIFHPSSSSSLLKSPFVSS